VVGFTNPKFDGLREGARQNPPLSQGDSKASTVYRSVALSSNYSCLLTAQSCPTMSRSILSNFVHRSALVPALLVTVFQVGVATKLLLSSKSRSATASVFRPDFGMVSLVAISQAIVCLLIQHPHASGPEVPLSLPKTGTRPRLLYLSSGPDADSGNKEAPLLKVWAWTEVRRQTSCCPGSQQKSLSASSETAPAGRWYFQHPQVSPSRRVD